ncbi:MAG: DUF4249 domain-containing protein [Bacteroidales bacterium]|nr:DUF4249 domain-containing protein [Bacteroidales bacterium]
MKTNKSKSIASIIGVFIITCMLSACVEKTITIKPLAYETKPVIECMITPGKKPRLFLSSTVAYFDKIIDNKDLTIRNAIVTITNSFGTEVLREDSVFNLFSCQYEYFYQGDNLIQGNTTYTLTVNAMGGIFTAQTTTNLSPVTITSVDYTSQFNDIYGEHEGVIVDFNDIAGQKNFYRYQMNRMIDSTVTYGETKVHSVCTNGSFFHVVEIGRSSYKDKNQDGLPFEIVVEPAFKHAPDQVAYVMIQTIDSNAAEFYDALDRQKLSLLNPFVEPVFLRPVQFKDAIGIFGNYILSDSVKFVYPE